MVARHGIARKGVLPTRFAARLCTVARARRPCSCAFRLHSRSRQARSRTATPQAYREARGGATECRAAAARLVAHVPLAELTSLIEQATNNNFDIAVAIAQILQADAQVRIAGASLLPTIDSTAATTASRSSAQLGGSGASGVLAAFAVLAALHHVSQRELHRRFLGQEQSGPERRRGDRDRQPLQPRGRDADDARTVANTYFQIIAAQDRLRIARRNLTDANRILFLIQQQFGAGTASDLNVAQQESLVEMVRATHPAAAGNRAPEYCRARGPGRQGARALQRARRRHGRPITVPRITPGLPSELLNQRPDVRLAEQQLAQRISASSPPARRSSRPSSSPAQLGFESAALNRCSGRAHGFTRRLRASLSRYSTAGYCSASLEQQKGLQLQYLQAYRKTHPLGLLECRPGSGCGPGDHRAGAHSGQCGGRLRDAPLSCPSSR